MWKNDKLLNSREAVLYGVSEFLCEAAFSFS